MTDKLSSNGLGLSLFLSVPVTLGMASVTAMPGHAASFASSESLLEVVFSQPFGASATDTDSDARAIAIDGEVAVVADADADILNEIADSPVCLLDLAGPGACNFAFSEAIGDDGNDYIGQGFSFSEAIGDFFVPSGNEFSFGFLAALLLETEIDRPAVETAEASGSVAFEIYSGTKSSDLTLLDTFTLAGHLETLGLEDPVTISPTSDAFNFDFILDDTESSLNNSSELVDVVIAGTYSRYFSADTYLKVVEVKESFACVAAGRGDDACEQKIPEPSTTFAFLTLLLGMAGISVRRSVQ